MPTISRRAATADPQEGAARRLRRAVPQVDDAVQVTGLPAAAVPLTGSQAVAGLAGPFQQIAGQGLAVERDRAERQGAEAGAQAAERALTTGDPLLLTEAETLRAQARNARALRVFAVGEKVSISNKVAELHAQFDDDPEGLRTALDAYFTERETAFPDDAATRTILRSVFLEQTGRAVLAAEAERDLLADEEMAETLLSSVTELNRQGRQAVSAGDDAQASRIRGTLADALDDLVEIGAIKATARGDALADFDTGVAVAGAMGPVRAAVRAGDIEAAEAAFQQYKASPDSALTPDQNDAVLRAMGTLIDGERTDQNRDRKERTRMVLDNRLDILRRYERGDETAFQTEEELTEDVEAGLMSPRGKRAILRAQDAATKKLREVATIRGGIERAMAVPGMGMPDTKDHQEVLGRMFLEEVARETQLPEAEQRTPVEIAGGFARKTGFYPQPWVDQVNSFTRNTNNPELFNAGAQAYVQALALAPLAAEQAFSTEEASRLSFFAFDTGQANQTPEQAMENLLAAFNVSEEIRKQREKEFAGKDIDGSQEGAAIVEDLFGIDQDEAVPNRFDAVVEARNRIALQAYIRHGRIDSANEEAARIVLAKWGVTEIGGVRQLLEFPPELMYPAYAGWMQQDLFNTLEDRFVQFSPLMQEPTTMQLLVGGATAAGRQVSTKNVIQDWEAANGVNVAQAIKDRKVEVIFDSYSAREAPGVSGALQSSYVIAVRNDKGNLVPLPGADGFPFRWFPDPENSRAFDTFSATIERESAERADRLREREAARGRDVFEDIDVSSLFTGVP